MQEIGDKLKFTDIEISKTPSRKDRFLEIDSDTYVVVTGTNIKYQISGHDIGKTLWKASSYASGLLLKYGITARSSADLDGGGRQGVFLYNNVPLTSEELYKNLIATAIFSTRVTEDWVYEAILWEDARKAHEPSINRGKQKFAVETVSIIAKDNSDILKFINTHYLQWERYLEYAVKTRSNITEWVDSELGMIIRCHSCGHEAILSNNSLREYLGINLSDFRRKLACVKCGSKNPIIAAN